MYWDGWEAYGGFYSKGKGSTGFTSYFDCHDGNKKIFEKDGITVYGGGKNRDADPAAVHVVLDLDDNVARWVVPETWECFAFLPKVLKLKISDYGTPVVHKDFWDALWKDLEREAQTTNPLRVLAMCQGGHGRTGLVLCALALSAGAVPQKKDVVAWLRKKYCDGAVESSNQIAYLEDEYGIKVKASPAKTYATATVGSYGFKCAFPNDNAIYCTKHRTTKCNDPCKPEGKEDSQGRKYCPVHDSRYCEDDERGSYRKYAKDKVGSIQPKEISKAEVESLDDLACCGGKGQHVNYAGSVLWVQCCNEGKKGEIAKYVEEDDEDDALLSDELHRECLEEIHCELFPSVEYTQEAFCRAHGFYKPFQGDFSVSDPMPADDDESKKEFAFLAAEYPEEGECMSAECGVYLAITAVSQKGYGVATLYCSQHERTVSLRTFVEKLLDVVTN